MKRFSRHCFSEYHCRPGETVAFDPRPGCIFPFVIVRAEVEEWK